MDREPGTFGVLSSIAHLRDANAAILRDANAAILIARLDYRWHVTSKPLPRSSPSQQSVDPAGIVDFIDALEAASEIEPHSMMLLRHGSVIAEGWWHPYTADRVHLLYSLSKSFTATAVGLAVTEGLISLDATVLSYFPEIDGDITDPRSRSMLVRHVAAMASGHHAETIERAMVLDPTDMVRGFLLIPPEEDPGSFFAYNQPCTYALAAIVQRVSGQLLTDFLQPRLFDPLGIEQVGWIRDSSGREIGFSGLHTTTETIAKLGQLYLQGGRWQGEQILTAEWTAEATRKHIDNSANIEPDWRQGYGFQFWMARHGYRGDGAYGQFCVVLPEHDVVLAITSQTPDMQKVLDLVWQVLLPALKRGDNAMPQPDEMDESLAQRLSMLRRPVATGNCAAPDTVSQKFSAAADNDHPTLTEVTIEGTTAGRLHLGLLDGTDHILAELVIGKWSTTDVVATNGAWIQDTETGRTAMCIEVAFIETPHTLHLRCWPDDGTFQSRWMNPPLHPLSLARMRMPARG